MMRSTYLASLSCIVFLFCAIIHSCRPEDVKLQLNGVYAGWLGRLNLGDELVLDIYSALLAECLKRQTGSDSAGNPTQLRVTLQPQLGGVLLIDAQGGMLPGVVYPQFNFTQYHFAVLGGGSLLEPVETAWGSFCKAARGANLPMYLHATGTQLVTAGGKLRISTQVLRCIEHPTFGGLRGPITVHMLRNMAKHWSRGNPRSDVRRRFNMQLPIISDSGILAAHIFPRQQSAPILELIDRNRAPAGVVCISGFPQGLDAARLIRTWAAKYSVVLMPVDHMVLAHVDNMHRDIIALEPALADRIFVNPHLTNYSVWLSLLDRCSVMLTSRLHAMIMAASAQRPFRIFPEPAKSQLKILDFINNTFGVGLDRFEIPRGWTGSLEEIDEILGAREMRRWRARYNSSYKERVILKPYELHLQAMGRFVRSLMPPATGFQGFMDARVAVERYFDRAVIRLSFW